MVRLVLGLVLTLGLLSSGAVVGAPAKPAYATAQKLRAFVATALPTASTYFRALRGGVKNTNDSYIFFKLSPTFAKICPSCNVADEFATADANERFAAEAFWPIPPSWTKAQAGAFMQTNIAPLMKGYPAQHGKSDDGNVWYDWVNTKTQIFVYAQTYRDTGGNGIDVRIGHYLPVNANYVKWARLTTQDRTDLTNGLVEFVTAGESAAAQNFASLRGAATDKDNNFFKVNQSFGPVLTACEVDGTFADEGAEGSGATGKWILECDTPGLGGSKADVLELVRAAVAGALTDNFTATTDPKYLGTSDYRWDRSSDSVSVDIDSYDEDDGTISYHISIYHYLN